MTEYETAVLNVLARAGEPLGWYQIERRLSNHSLAIRPDLLDVLADLGRRGLVERIAATTTPTLRYAVTESGRTALDELDD